MPFCHQLIVFKINLLKKFFEEYTCTIRVSNSLDSDQARHFVGPDLGANCLLMLSADDTEVFFSIFRNKPMMNRTNSYKKIFWNLRPSTASVIMM